MPQFKVLVTIEATASKYVTVMAENADKAAEQAVEQSIDTVEGWELNDRSLYDPIPYAAPEDAELLDSAPAEVQP